MRSVSIWFIFMPVMKRQVRRHKKGEMYRDIIEKTRDFSKELVICVSLSGRQVTDFNERVASLQIDETQNPIWAA